MKRNTTLFIKNFLKKIPFLEKPLTYFRKRLIFYTTLSDFECLINSDNSPLFKVINNFDEFLSIAKLIDMPVDSKVVYNRFNNNNIFYLLHNNYNYLSYGWGAQGETSLLVDFFNVTFEIGDGAEILFDFKTNENFRRRGYYRQLLINIIGSKKGCNFIIYTAPVNEGSRKGIISSGFKPISVHTKFNIKKLEKKLKKVGVYLKVVK